MEDEPGFAEWWATQIVPLKRVVLNFECLPFKEVARAAWIASKKHQKENKPEPISWFDSSGE